MKNKRLLSVALFCILLVAIPACQKSEPEKNNAVKMNSVGLGQLEEMIAKDSPEEYFPTFPGTRWVYKITIGDTEPINTRIVSWNASNRITAKQVTSRYQGLLGSEGGKNYILVLRVKGPAPTQGPLHYPKSVELEVEKDELGIFERAEHVYWAIADYDRFNVLEVLTYSPDSIYAPIDSWGVAGNGYSIRVFMFEASPGTSISIEHYAEEELVFVDFDSRNSALLFIRNVDGMNSSLEEEYNLGKPYQENMLFEKGVGLTFLRQEIGGKTSMIWRLVQFSPAERL